MNRPHPLLYELQRMIDDLSLIERKSEIPGTNRHENDIEHSMTVAILCWYIHDKYNLDLNLELILKYALTHDFVERYAGDVSTFAPQAERDAKVLREQESLKRMSTELADFSGLVKVMEQYESKPDQESLFVWSVDKIQQLINGELDNWIAYQEGGIVYDQFVKKYDELASKSSPYCREIFEGIVAYSKPRFYDQPKT